MQESLARWRVTINFITILIMRQKATILIYNFVLRLHVYDDRLVKNGHTEDPKGKISVSWNMFWVNKLSLCLETNGSGHSRIVPTLYYDLPSSQKAQPELERSSAYLTGLQDVELLGFRICETPKNGAANPKFMPGFPTGNPEKMV